MADKLLKNGLSGAPLRLMDNGDGSFSISAYIQNQSEGGSAVEVPEMIKVPKKLMEPTVLDQGGYPLFVDTDGTLYIETGGNLISTSDGINFTSVLKLSTVDSSLTRIEGFAITRNSRKCILSARIDDTVGGQIWVADSVEGPYTKVLDNAATGYGEASFRQSNFWHYGGYGKDILLVGTYGRYNATTNPNKTNRLFLSMDEGATWTNIFESPTVDNTRNRHIHATAYDPYYQWIWVAYGDGDNAGISYSPDFGSSWVQVSDEHQPTAIVPMEKCVAFGSDDAFHSGVYVWERPETAGLVSEIPQVITQKWHKLHDYGTSKIARKGVAIDNQHGAIPLLKSTTATGTVIAITGDGGASWHPGFTMEDVIGDWGCTNAGPDGEFYWCMGKGMIGKFTMPEFYDRMR